MVVKIGTHPEKPLYAGFYPDLLTEYTHKKSRSTPGRLEIGQNTFQFLIEAAPSSSAMQNSAIFNKCILFVLSKKQLDKSKEPSVPNMHKLNDSSLDSKLGHISINGADSYDIYCSDADEQLLLQFNTEKIKSTISIRLDCSKQ